jgi:hypothetical protein
LYGYFSEEFFKKSTHLTTWVMRYAALALLIVSLGCKSAPKDSSPLGSWRAQKIQLLRAESGISDNTPRDVRTFGSATLELTRDSVYNLHIEVLKDITTTQRVLGVEVTKTVVPAVYKGFRTGRAVLSDSALTLLDADQHVLASGVLKLYDSEMIVNFVDSKGRSWWSSWTRE